MEEITPDRLIRAEKAIQEIEVHPSRVIPFTPEEQGANTERAEYFSWRDVLGKAIVNSPHSAIETGKSMVMPFLHPIETGKSLGKIAAGAYQKITPGEQEYEQNIDALVQFYKDRYGNVDNFKKTLAEDPIGVTTDVATMFAGGGGALKAAGTVSKLESISKVGSQAAKIGSRMELHNIAKAAITGPAKLLPSSLAEGMYQSAVKFATTLPLNERLAVTKTALKAENQIMPTLAGLGELKDKINSLNSQVEELISTSNLGFYKFDISGLRKGLNDLKDEMLKNTDNPIPARNAYNNISKNLDEVERLGQMRTPAEVQRIKQNIYKELESFYEQHKASPAKVTLRKAIARNAREMIEDIVPEVKKLNADEGALIELWDAIESKAARTSNRDLIGLSAPVKVASGAAGGYAIAGPVGAKVGTAFAIGHAIIDNPIIKAKLAIVISRIKEQGIQLHPTQAAIRLGLVQAGRTQEQKPRATLIPNMGRTQ